TSKQLGGDALSGGDLGAGGLQFQLGGTPLGGVEPFLRLLRFGLLRLADLLELGRSRLQLVVVRELRALPTDARRDSLVELLLRGDRLKLGRLVVGFFRALSGGRLLRHGSLLDPFRGRAPIVRRSRLRAATEETVEALEGHYDAVCELVGELA